MHIRRVEPAIEDANPSADIASTDVIRQAREQRKGNKILERIEGKTILVVEDDYFIANDLCRVLENEGVQVLGPVGRVDHALGVIAKSDRIDGALVDLNLHGVMAYPVADALTDRCVPFLFLTGYDRAAIPERFKNVPHCQKPVAPEDARDFLFGRARSSP